MADWETRLQTEAEFKSLPEPLTRAHLVKDGLRFSSVPDGIYALGKSLMRSIPSLRRFPNVPDETVPMFVFASTKTWQ